MLEQSCESLQRAETFLEDGRDATGDPTPPEIRFRRRGRLLCRLKIITSFFELKVSNHESRGCSVAKYAQVSNNCISQQFKNLLFKKWGVTLLILC
jgi:hypothetical protein